MFIRTVIHYPNEHTWEVSLPETSRAFQLGARYNTNTGLYEYSGYVEHGEFEIIEIMEDKSEVWVKFIPSGHN